MTLTSAFLYLAGYVTSRLFTDLATPVGVVLAILILFLLLVAICSPILDKPRGR